MKNEETKVNYFLLSCLLFSCIFISCNSSKFGSGKARKISEVRLIPPVFREVQKNVSHESFKRVINGDGEVNKARMVEIYRRGQSKEAPAEYRLLDVDKEGIFYLIGLRNRDVIVAADGYVIPSGQLFWEYIKLMDKTKNASIEIKRGGRTILLNIILS